MQSVNVVWVCETIAAIICDRTALFIIIVFGYSFFIQAQQDIAYFY